MNLQCADGIESVKEGQKSSVGNQVVNTALANNLGSVGSSLLKAGMADEVCLEDVDIGTVSDLGSHLLVGRSFATDQTDH